MPSHIYKYESVTTRSLQNLKNQVIYFGSPLNFNDPYDCALAPSIRVPNDDEIERIRSAELRSKTLPEEGKEIIRRRSATELRLMYLRIGQDAVNGAIRDFLKKNGVSCFSERNDSLLMWAHYGGHSKGLCLQFDTNFDPFRNLRQVKYTQEMPEIDLLPIICDRNFDQILDLYCTKALDWAYEQEWRGIHREVGIAYTYKSQALTSVYFGPEIPFELFEIVCLILAGQNEQVKLWRGMRSKSDFSVDFESVQYTSHVDAKRQGLLKPDA